MIYNSYSYQKYGEATAGTTLLAVIILVITLCTYQTIAKTRWSYEGKTGKKIKQAVFETIGVLISFLVLIPFLMVLVNSMKSKRQANLLQLNLKGISLGQIVENYGTVIKRGQAGIQLP